MERESGAASNFRPASCIARSFVSLRSLCISFQRKATEDGNHHCSSWSTYDDFYLCGCQRPRYFHKAPSNAISHLSRGSKHVEILLDSFQARIADNV